ncbi:MAG: hypothetical protein LAP39_22710 [Acidobacteriia bacterium]|nr:hypothetical protein [Terriglobia bacterium]
MPAKATPLQNIIRRLETVSGRPKPPITTDPFELILWENVAYLANDDERARAFSALRERIGTKPGCISAASGEELLAVTRQGRGFASQCAEKLRRADQIALRLFKGNLKKSLQLPYLQARKAFQEFPGIGEPGAEKILLFSSAQPVFALESNGLRVLRRLGFGGERKIYIATYRAVQAAVINQIVPKCGWLIRAHQLLRQHGQEVCKTNRPRCEACCLNSDCRFYQSQGTSRERPSGSRTGVSTLRSTSAE